ncbi:MAG: hypothetical protein V4582_22525 [Pseudomonadota bacterium]
MPTVRHLAKLLAWLAVAALPGARAQTPAAANPPRQVIVGSAPRLSTQELAQYSGFYRMSDGRTLLIKRQVRTLIAQLGDTPSREIVAVAPDVFVSRDGSMRLAFQGGAADVSLTLRAPG